MVLVSLCEKFTAYDTLHIQSHNVSMDASLYLSWLSALAPNTSLFPHSIYLPQQIILVQNRLGAIKSDNVIFTASLSSKLGIIVLPNFNNVQRHKEDELLEMVLLVTVVCNSYVWGLILLSIFHLLSWLNLKEC